MPSQIITVSSKGRITLPISIRKDLSIKSSDKLVAYTFGDAIILKTLKFSSINDFEIDLKKAQKWAKSVGYNQEDVDDIIKSYRKSN